MGSSIKTTALKILASAEFKAYAYVVLLVGLCALAILWRFNSISSIRDALKMLAPVLPFQSRLWMGVCIIIVYLVGGLVAFPVVILIPVMALVAGPVLGCVYSLAGLLSSATVLYIVGFKLGHETVSRISSRRVSEVSQRLSRHGLLTIITLRLLPIAPFTVVNLVAGSCNIVFRKYLVGTLIGIFPAVIIMSVAGDTLGKAITSNVLLLMLLIVAVILSLILIFFRRSKKNNGVL